MEKVGQVVYVEGKNAFIDVRRSSSCGDKCSTCGSGCDAPSIRIKANNKLGAKQGDIVKINMATEDVLKSALIVYIIPLVMLIVGIISGSEISKSMGIQNYELIGMFSGFVLLFFSFLILRMIDKKISNKNNMKIQITKVFSM